MTTREKFFFDTADISYIQKTWEQMSSIFSGKEVVGITTNPNALDKVSCYTMKDFEERTRNLCKLVSEIRRDSKGVVYVQLPNCDMKSEDILKFTKIVSNFSDGKTMVGLKIPPYKRVLELSYELNSLISELNVTGVADCATALKSFAYDIRYASIIPGRMEEKGIDAKSQIAFINQRRDNGAELITGSMRTIQGLEWCIEYNTVPTIGSRVFDLILANGKEGIEQFKNMWNYINSEIEQPFSPNITDEMRNLSLSFFEQMNKLGQPLYEDFLNTLGK